MAGLLDPRQGDGTWVENRPSKWQRTLGILNEYNPIDAFWRLHDSDMARGGTITDENIADGLTVTGMVMGGSAFAPKPANSLNMGIRAFHGSPHDFPPVRLIEMPDGTRLYQNMGELADTPQGARIIKDYPIGRFDLSKIGTGEGAQAYGHGLYFAENENIALSYRDSLSPGTRYKGGNRYTIPDGTAEGSAANAVMDLVTEGMTPADAMAAVKKRYLDAANSMDPALFEQGSMSTRAANANRYRGYMDIADAIDELSADDFVHIPGRVYEVEINADPDAFLDWDKPLSEQPGVADKLRAMGALNDKGDLTFMYNETPSRGGEMYERLTSPLAKKVTGGEGQGAATDALRKAGIPGIKYLDAGSRGSGDGTRNYVVFDESLIEILRKYGIAGLLGMSAATNAMLDQPQEVQ